MFQLPNAYFVPVGSLNEGETVLGPHGPARVLDINRVPKGRHLEIVQYLAVERGVDAIVAHSDGVTALMVGAGKGHLEIVLVS